MKREIALRRIIQWGQAEDQNRGARFSQFHTVSKLLPTSILKSEGRRDKFTSEGRRVVYDVSLLMNHLLSSTATERDHKVTGNINRRRALAFAEFYVSPAALTHDCSAQGHRSSVRHQAGWNMQFV